MMKMRYSTSFKRGFVMIYNPYNRKAASTKKRGFQKDVMCLRKDWERVGKAIESETRTFACVNQR